MQNLKMILIFLKTLHISTNKSLLDILRAQMCLKNVENVIIIKNMTYLLSKEYPRPIYINNLKFLTINA